MSEEFAYSLAGIMYPPASVVSVRDIAADYRHLQEQDVIQLNLDRGPDDPVGDLPSSARGST